MAKQVFDLGDGATGKLLADLTVVFCKAVSTGAAVSQAGAALREEGGGVYVYDNPNVAEDTTVLLYLTADPARRAAFVLSPADGDLARATTQAAIKAKTDNLPAQPAAVGSAMTLTAAYDAAKSAASQASVAAIPTNPLLAGDSRLDYLDAAVSSRLAAAVYSAPDNATISAIQAKTANLPAQPAAAGDVTAARDAVLAVLQDAAFGLSRLDAELDALTVALGTLALNDDVQTLLSRLSSTRAGYLDNLTRLDQTLTQLAANVRAGLISDGAYALTVQVYETDSTTPIPDVTVSLFNSDLTVFLQEATTDTDGRAAFSADAATYQLRRHKAGFVFSDPDAVVVAGSGTHLSYGDSYIPPASADPATQILSGTHTEGGRAVKAVPAGGQTVDAVTIDQLKLTDTTETTAPHTWSLTLLKHVEYQITIQGWGSSKTIMISDAAGAEFTDYP